MQGLGGWTASGAGTWNGLNGQLLFDGQGDDLGMITAPFTTDSMTNFAVEARVRVLRTTCCVGILDNNLIGVGFIVRDNLFAGEETVGNYHLVSMWAGPDQYRTPLDDATFHPGTTVHDIRLEVRGNAYKLFVDHSLMLTVTSNQDLTGNSIGIYAARQEVSISKFRVTSFR
jgi:hypothetical protein